MGKFLCFYQTAFLLEHQISKTARYRIEKYNIFLLLMFNCRKHNVIRTSQTSQSSVEIFNPSLELKDCLVFFLKQLDRAESNSCATNNAVISLYGKSWHNTLYVNCWLSYRGPHLNRIFFLQKQFFAPNYGMFVMFRRNVRRKNVRVRFVTVK